MKKRRAQPIRSELVLPLGQSGSSNFALHWRKIKKKCSLSWPRSNERNLRKTRKIVKRKGCRFQRSKFDTVPVSCWFTNLFGTVLKKVLSIWKQGEFVLLGAILSGWGVFKSQETRLCEANESTFTLNSYYIYPRWCSYLIVNENSWNKTKNCPRRLTAVDPLSKPINIQ